MHGNDKYQIQKIIHLYREGRELQLEKGTGEISTGFVMLSLVSQLSINGCSLAYSLHIFVSLK